LLCILENESLYEVLVLEVFDTAFFLENLVNLFKVSGLAVTV